jgi:hypothetical protein
MVSYELSAVYEMRTCPRRAVAMAPGEDMTNGHGMTNDEVRMTKQVRMTKSE